MTIQHLQEKILRLKTEQDVCILAHSYQAQEILEIADFTGDSFQLQWLHDRVLTIDELRVRVDLAKLVLLLR